ncbi:MAG: hypothetical protein ABJN04_14585 [Hyphomicrobiales bacterium]
MGVPMRRKEKVEHFTKLIRPMMETPAWRALSPTAQALYPWLKLEWRGPDNNNNGKIQFSVRQAKESLGVSINTAAKAFHELQAKGFIVVKEPAKLGSSGEAKSPAYEITELRTRTREEKVGRKLYMDWREGRDYPVIKAQANNPKGANGKTKAHLKNDDVTVLDIETFRERAS